MRTFDLHLSIASHRDPGFVGALAEFIFRVRDDHWTPPNGSGEMNLAPFVLKIFPVVEVSGFLGPKNPGIS